MGLENSAQVENVTVDMDSSHETNSLDPKKLERGRLYTTGLPRAMSYIS